MQSNKDPNALSVIGHLEELRARIWFSLIYVALGTLTCFYFAPLILKILKNPSFAYIPSFIVIKPTEAVIVYFKVSLYSGFLLASPFVFFEFWKFIKPALNTGSTVFLLFWILPAFLLFILGSAFSYFAALPLALKFLMNISYSVAEPMITINSYISFVLSVLILGSLIFEMPLISAILSKIGILNPSIMRKKRREAIIVMMAVAAVLTPTTDVFNMVIFVIPMIALYEVSILTSKLAIQRKVRD